MAETCEEYSTLSTGIDWLLDDLAERFGKSIPPGMRPSITNLARGIEREITPLRPKKRRRGLGRYAEQLRDTDQVLKCYRRIQTLLELLALNANVNIWMLVDEQATRSRLGEMSPSYAAWYCSAESQELDRDECTPDTRVEVLERFRVWRDDNQSENIYWLNGMAGTGKTTLSYTLCEQLEEDSRLAANFFCSRQLPTCRDAKRILPTIAYQLANFSYPFRYALSRVLEQNSDVYTRRISEQFTKLLYVPLCEVRVSLPSDLVVVIEALDECESPESVGEILDALLGHASDLPIRFFLTSRPEPEIRERMSVRSGKRERFELHLHNLDQSIVKSDIRKYLQVGLKRMDISDEDLETLTDRCGVLFIYAATVVRYVGAFNFSRSADRLEQVLTASTSSCDSDKQVNSLYTLILMSAFDDPDMTDREKEEMRLVLRTAICAPEPLNARVMAGLLGFKRADSVHAALSPLRSVLNIQTANEGITTLHKSFPDYMFSKTRSQRFYCDAEQHHHILVKRFLDLMDPPFNICGLESSFTSDEDVHNLDQRVERHISEGLFYACCYWGTHLELAARSQRLWDDVHAFLSTRLLLWMEAMNLKRCLHDVGVKVISQVRDYVERWGHATEDQELARDAYDFVVAYSNSPASRSTPHIYISGLSFWAPERPVSVYYSRLFHSPIPHTTTLAQPRAFIPLVIYSIGSSVRCVTYSPDGTRIAAGSDDGAIHVWGSHTGWRIRASLEGHDGPISSITYSRDGKNLVSSSTDGSIRIWDVKSRRADKILHDEEAGAVYSARYNQPACSHVISGSADGTIRYWFPKINRFCRAVHKGPVEPIYSVAQSSDGRRAVSGSSSGTILTWDTHKGEATTTRFVGHTAAVYSLAFSPDSTRIISGSADKTARIWDTETGQAIIGSPLEGHTAAVTSVVYSPNGRRVISGSMDGTIRVWDSSSSKIVLGPLVGHGGPVYSVACSPDGTTITSGSADGTIRLWSADTGQPAGEPLHWHCRASHYARYSNKITPNNLASLTDLACFWGARAGGLLTSPTRESIINDAVPATCPTNTVKGYSKLKEANVIYIQDHFSRLDEYAPRGLPGDYPQSPVLAEAGSESSHLASQGHCFRWDVDWDGGIVINSTHWFWLLQNVQNRIWHPQATGTIHEHNALWLDLSTAMVGERWHQCYAPQKQNDMVNENTVPYDPDTQTSYLVLLAVVLVFPSILSAYMFTLAS
ncbi:hypothetical protein FRC09_006190 [Ceratobasidium sp. 395]|nr:hypothetical protein FRC09_006190 [Ceratobasidium sp. 395]